jgi:hypothetical protein
MAMKESIKSARVLQGCFLVLIFTTVMSIPFGNASSNDPSEITILTYNTHLFEDTHLVVNNVEDVELCTFAPANCYVDTSRRYQIVEKIRMLSGVDIVALEEVWGQTIQDWFITTLKDIYPYAATGGKDCSFRIGSGVVVVSKWPLLDVEFEQFPVFEWTLVPGNSDYWASKGVLTATVQVGNRSIRLGTSHALTQGKDVVSTMSKYYVDIVPFQMNGDPYIFALNANVGANIFRIDDHGVSSGRHGAGKTLVRYGDSMSPNYVALTSFELNGHPYIFGLHKDVGANIWRINDDPSTGLTLVKYGASMSPNYVALTSFELNGHPYILGLHKAEAGSESVGANIWRINDDPSTGFTLVKYGASMSDRYNALTSFELNGHPYIFGLHKDVGANIWRINDDPSTGFTLVKYGASMSPNYLALTSFELNGHPYIFGLHRDVGANIWRINDDPSTGLTLIHSADWENNYKFIRSLQLNGHPYLFSLKECCEDQLDSCGRSRPGESYITRINDDPSTGWEDVVQQEDVQIIRDQTVRDHPGLPAIMLGDFNVHKSKYGIAASIFRGIGAVDAYCAVNEQDCEENVNGLWIGGQTIDCLNNQLYQIFNPDKDCSQQAVYPKESTFDRIDYVYVKQEADNWRLVPMEAYVIRDWKYEGPNLALLGLDLSDHYPLVVRFKLSPNVPAPDIKANGSDGPITLGSSTTISVTVTLNPGGLAGNNADWWGAVSTPFGWYFYTFAGWTTNQQSVYQGSLFNLSSREVLNMPASSLPAGIYTLYFGVDTVMDGKLTMGSGYYDSVQVNVVK